MQALFLLGLNDSRTIAVTGYDEQGELLYNWKGNASFHKYLDIPPEDKKFISIVWNAEPVRQVTRPNIIVNCINDPDTCGKSLSIAIEMVTAIAAKWPGVALFNDPSKIAATSRDAIYNAFHAQPGLRIPKVIRIRPDSVEAVLREAIVQQIGFPFLIRTCGSHQAENLIKIDGPDDRKKLERYAYDGSEFYLTSYADYRGTDGLYRKGRLVIIGGEVFPRHYMTGEDWLVHGDLHQTYMAFDQPARQAEEDFIRNFRRMIAPRALASLQAIYEYIGLDYLGFDFAVMPNGDLLIFEINPAQNPFLTLDFKNFPYMASVRERIIRGLKEAVMRKTSLSA
jgi:hypothetical protein